jgi:hypothetical protein
MKLVKKLFASILSLFVYSILAVPAFAQNVNINDKNINPCVNSDGTAMNSIAGALCRLGTNPGKTIQSVVIFLIVLAVIIALMYLLYGGIKWITSRGEKTEVEAARNHIMAAIVGLIVVFVAIFIVSLVMSIFGLNLTTLMIPTINPQ